MEKASSPSGRGYCKDASDNIMMICFNNAVSLLTRSYLNFNIKHARSLPATLTVRAVNLCLLGTVTVPSRHRESVRVQILKCHQPDAFCSSSPFKHNMRRVLFGHLWRNMQSVSAKKSCCDVDARFQQQSHFNFCLHRYYTPKLIW